MREMQDRLGGRLNVEEIKLLLDEGANPNSADNLGRTPLHEAATFGRIRVVQLLLDAGANPHQADHSGETPISVASYYEWKYVADLMSLLSTDDQRNLFVTNSCGETSWKRCKSPFECNHDD